MKKAILSLVLLMSGMFAMAQGSGTGGIKEGDVAPNLTLKTEKGDNFDLYNYNTGSSYKVLFFWSSTNVESQRSLAVLKLLVDKYWINGVSFIGISFDTDANAWTKCFTDAKLNRMIHVSELKDVANSPAAKTYQLSSIPMVYLMDNTNKVAFATNDVNKLVYKLDELDRAGKLINNAYQTPDQMPEFRGGKKILMMFLSRSVRYPQKALQMGAQAKVTVTFVVDKDGKVQDITPTGYDLISIGSAEFSKLDDAGKEAAKSSIHDLFCAEAQRVVSGMPKWKPGLKNGQPISVKYDLPITFRMTFSE